MDYVDPTGEILGIVGRTIAGGIVGGIFGGAGGFISSAISQKIEKGKVSWKEARGKAINGAITGAAQGGLIASGAGLPAALVTNFLSGTAGSAAEQKYTRGRVSIGRSIFNGIDNMVSNAIYGTVPLKGVKDAAIRGVKAGGISGGLGYLADLADQNPEWGSTGLLTGVAGKILSSYMQKCDPRRGYGSVSPFMQSLGYSSAKGYQYTYPETSGLERKAEKFNFWKFLGNAAMGAVTGGVTSAAFYGAGKGIEKLVAGVRAGKGSGNPRNILNVGAGDNPIPCATNIDINPNAPGVIYGDVNNLEQFASGQFDHVIALNPYKYNLLDSDASRVLKEGGVMSVAGNLSNKFFNRIYNASAETLNQAGFEMVSKGGASGIFTKYGGKVTGGARYIKGIPMQIILRKVGGK